MMLTPEQRQTYIDHIRQLPEQLAALVGDLSTEQLTTAYLPGEWTVAQNVHHLADSHMNSYIRCKLIATEDNPPLKPYDQDQWARFADATDADITVSLQLLNSLHTRWVTFWEALSETDWQRAGYHPENGVVSLEMQVELYAAHGLGHLDQITRTLAAQTAASAEDQHQLPQWEAFYQANQLEGMPWFNPELDDDLRRALEQLGLQSGDALDLGTGPGTQAVQLAQRGFRVTATDISAAAIQQAQAKAGEQGHAIIWEEDDILATQLNQQFDLVFDRGCFHVLAPERRAEYVRTVGKLLKPGGYFCLKCMSRLQPGEMGPYRFTAEEIREIFGEELNILSIDDTVYQGTLDPPPYALFCVMQQER